MVVFFWLLFAVAVGVWASNRGRSGVGWFLVAALLSPLLGAIFLGVSTNLAAPPGEVVATDATHVRCTACAEWVLPQATRCKHCGVDLVPDLSHQARVVEAAQVEESDAAFKQVLVAVALALLVVGAYLAAR